MNSYIIIGFLIILLAFYFTNLEDFTQYKETFADMSSGSSSTLNQLSNEAISNIASVYNKNNMNVTNINVTDSANIKNLTASGTDFKLGVGDTSRGNCGACRATVKDNNNTLVINYANDYAAGTRIDGNLYAGNILFSKGWTGYPDNKTDGSEISNDIGSYKELMLVGNKSSGGNRRVGVWDNLSVHGNQQISGDLSVTGNLTVKSIKLGDSLGDRIIRKRTDVDMCPSEDINHYGGIANLDDCINKCISSHAEAMSCSYAKSGDAKGTCWCKRGVNNAKYDTKFDSAIII